MQYTSDMIGNQGALLLQFQWFGIRYIMEVGLASDQFCTMEFFSLQSYNQHHRSKRSLEEEKNKDISSVEISAKSNHEMKSNLTGNYKQPMRVIVDLTVDPTTSPPHNVRIYKCNLSNFCIGTH
jgi:hypothetical protein